MDFTERLFGKFTNGRVLLQAGNSLLCPTQPLLNKDINVKDNKQKPKDACPAETEADSEPQPKITTSSPACSNTFVGRSASSRSAYANIVICPLFTGFISVRKLCHNCNVKLRIYFSFR